MPDAVLITRSGLAAAIERLDVAARNVAAASAPQAPPRDGGPITGATGAPPGSMDKPAAALIDLMTAELEFRASVQAFRTAADMVRSLYAIFD